MSAYTEARDFVKIARATPGVIRTRGPVTVSYQAQSVGKGQFEVIAYAKDEYWFEEEENAAAAVAFLALPSEQQQALLVACPWNAPLRERRALFQLGLLEGVGVDHDRMDDGRRLAAWAIMHMAWDARSLAERAERADGAAARHPNDHPWTTKAREALEIARAKEQRDPETIQVLKDTIANNIEPYHTVKGLIERLLGDGSR